MEQGKVKWFSQEKGYGFITSNSGVDHYFNVQAINGANLPSNGDNVSFESISGNKGAKAANVSIERRVIRPKPRQVDDRVNCPSCNKKIVPRMITYQGNPQKSICPYCAALVKNFQPDSNNWGCFIAIAVVFLLFLIVVNS
ncbi:cold-shock protein [Shewanella basaltis]|uniref:cold-shock protein n=1 Tax=Shewanella basaltis TaxID=472183 RepID=UPI003AABA3E3